MTRSSAAELSTPATAQSPVAPGADKAPSLGRLTLVELRKLADTRAGMWLLIVIGLATVATSAVLLGWGDDAEQNFRDFFVFGLAPSSILLPVLGVLSVTSEWSQRTALVTFTLVPSRSRVLIAKVLAGTLVSLAVTAATAAVSAVANLVGEAMGGHGAWRIEGSLVWQSVLLLMIFVLMGLGFGALLQNTPLAIVTFFALPMVWTLLGATITKLAKAAEWLDINTTSLQLSEPDMTGGEYARLGVSVAVWVLLPLAAGTVRVLRREVS